MAAPVHLRKLCVGVDAVADLARWQEEVRAGLLRPHQKGQLWHVTRARPRRAAEVLDGGSLYWIIRGVMRARQHILDLVDHIPDAPEDGDRPLPPEGRAPRRPQCRIVLHPELILTAPRPHRPFQGWRYLEDTDAPADVSVFSAPGSAPGSTPGDDAAARPSAALREHLRDMGLA